MFILADSVNKAFQVEDGSSMQPVVMDRSGRFINSRVLQLGACRRLPSEFGEEMPFCEKEDARLQKIARVVGQRSPLQGAQRCEERNLK